MDISIIIPTKDRIKYLIRALEYYENLNFDGKILILDGSNEEKHFEMCSKISNFKLNINVYKSSFAPLLAVRDVITEIKTNFVTFMGDDDYQIPSGLQKSINILNNRDDIIACHGQGLIINDPLYNKKSLIVDPGPYPGPHIIYNNSLERLIYQMENYACPFYSVFRTESYRNIFNKLNNSDILSNCKDRLIHDELLHSALMVIEGKIIRENYLQVIRGHHPGRKIAMKRWASLTDINDRIDSINYFTKTVSSRIAVKNNISKSEYLKISKSIKKLIESLENKKVEPPKIFRLFIKKIFIYLGLLNLFFFLREFFFKNEFKIKNLLNKKNIYYNDFKIIYDSLMNSKS